MSTIQASLFAKVTPSVLAPGGNAVDAIGLLLTTNTRVPIGTFQSFPDADAVSNFFGPASVLATLGDIYFEGYEGSSATPNALLVAQYPTSSVSAYLRGANISTVPLATLQSYSGTLSVTIDGSLKTSAVNLSSATSFSNAAEIIANDLGIEGVQAAAVTATFTGSSAVMTVTGVTSGTLSVADVIAGAGIASGTYITSLGTGTGGAGTYNLSATPSVGSGVTVTAFTPGVTFDSVSGAFVIISGTAGASSTITFGSGAMAADLLLTQTAGAVLSQGAIAAVPATFMTALSQLTMDWATLTTDFDPDNGSGNTNKLAFSAWVNTQDDEFAYIPWDTDVTPTASVPATNSMGYLLQQSGSSGTAPVWAPDGVTGPEQATFMMSIGASINFNQVGGRTTFAFRSQSGITPTVTNTTSAVNLGGDPQVVGNFGNGYNYYGAVGAANQGFEFLQRGTISGPFVWFDSFINQIVLNSAFQAAMLTFMAAMPSIPFNDAGATLIEQALSGVIQQFGDPAKGGFGAFAPGDISSQQAVDVNQAAGANISSTLQTQGYYLQVLQQSSAVRAARGPWAITFWYLDRGSVQSMTLSSIAVQ